MAGDFHAAVPALGGIAFSVTAATMAARAILANPRALMLVLDLGSPVGLLAAEEVDYPCGAAILTREAMFWIELGYRGAWAARMLTAYEEWARLRGAVIAGMTCFNDGRTHRLMERAGFVATEINFVKVF